MSIISVFVRVCSLVHPFMKMQHFLSNIFALFIVLLILLQTVALHMPFWSLLSIK